MRRNLLLIFTRNPELGKVKTRLAKTIGDEKALAIYQILLQKTKEETLQLNCDKFVYYSENIAKNDIWETSIYQKKLQKGADLGEKMYNAFAAGFELGYQKIIIIGSDLYDLTSKIIEDAFLKLDTNDVVLGPATDGGYYLLGLQKLHEYIFKNKAWGTSTVKEDTLADLKDKKVFLLAELNDIDIFEDIKNHPAFQQFI